MIMLALIGLLFAGLPDSAYAQTSQTAAVYNGTAPNTSPVVGGGVSRALRYSVTGKDGKTYETNYATTYANGGSYSTGFKHSSIIDIDQMASLNVAITISNTSSSSTTISGLYNLPEANRRKDKEYVPVVKADGTISASGSVNATVSFANTNNTAVRVSGTLAAGETLVVTIPMTLSNASTLDTSNGGWSVSYAKVTETDFSVNSVVVTSKKLSNQLSAYARFSNRVLNSSGADYLSSTKQYLATVRNSDGTYSTVPDDIQALMPTMTASDFITENVNRAEHYTNFAGVQSTFMDEGSNDTALYTGGTLYYLRTARIKDALVGSGWSVNNLTHPKIDDTDLLSDIYAYQTNGNGVTIRDSAGKLINSKSNPDILYAEIYQYIEAHDITIHVGDSYSAGDTLDWIHAYNSTDNLGLSDSRVSVDTSAVDTTTAGVYPVTYTYTPNKGESVTKTVHVTVLDAQKPAIADVDNQTITIEDSIAPITVNATDNSGSTTVTVTGLPDGVNYDSSTGVISGTPTTIGAYTVTVTATDASGNTSSITFTITVKPKSSNDSSSGNSSNNSSNSSTTKTAVKTNSPATSSALAKTGTIITGVAIFAITLLGIGLVTLRVVKKDEN